MVKNSKEGRIGRVFLSSIGLLLVVIVIAFSCLFFFICLNDQYHFGISGDGIVLTFVGALATFIVVGNYMQVKDIERKFESKTRDLSNKIDRTESTLEKKYRDADDHRQRIEEEINSIKKKVLKSKIEVDADELCVEASGYSMAHKYDQEYNALLMALRLYNYAECRDSTDKILAQMVEIVRRYNERGECVCEMFGFNRWMKEEISNPKVDVLYDLIEKNKELKQK